jgi:uncharacterized delta-60 repeat protein
MNVTKTLACASFILTMSLSSGRAADVLNPGDRDTSFLTGLGADERIFTVDVDTNGIIFIGGSFTGFNEGANGNPANNTRRFARLLPNGALDRVWSDAVNQQFLTKNGAGDAVNDLHVLADGKVILVGKFNSFYGQTYNRIIRLNNDGFIDTSFDAQGASRGFDSEVFKVDVDNNGCYLVGGRFSTYKDANGTHFATNLVRIFPDGMIDPTFVSRGYGGSSGNPINAIAVQADNKILVGGEYTSYDSFPNTVEVGRISRLNADGSLDTNFNVADGQPGSASGNIREIEIRSDGKIIAVGNIVNYNNVAASHIIRLNPDGSRDFSFTSAVDSQIRSVEIQPDGKLLITGDMRAVGNTTRFAAARLNPEGTLDTSFDPKQGTILPGSNTLRPVNDSKLDPNGNLVIVGEFTTWDDVLNVNRITRIATGLAPPAQDPLITDQPNSLTVTEGSPASFSIVATGTPTLTYQWKRNGANIPGANATTFTLPTTTIVGDNGAIFSICVTNGNGAFLASSNAVLTVINAPNDPLIVTPPANLTVTQPSPATFSASATGTGPLTYQWKRNGVDIPGANTTSYTLNPTLRATDNGALFSVCVTNVNNIGVVSPQAVLTVNLPANDPLIITHPLSLTVNAGSPATFTVAATGTPTITYQWKKNGINIPGAVGNSYTIPSAQTADQAQYKVCVQNGVALVESNPATLTVLTVGVAPSVTQQPQGACIQIGTTHTFVVGATGTPALRYQWLFNGAPLIGQTNASYTIPSVNAGHAGNYLVVVANNFGNTFSSAALLEIKLPPTIIGQPIPQSVKKDSSASFTVTVSGTGPFTYQWSFNGAAISGANAVILTLAGVTAVNQGNYSVLVSNAFGSVNSTTAFLIVLEAPVITQQPVSQTVTAGQALNLSVGVTGTTPIHFQWRLNGADLSLQTNQTISIANLQPSQAGAYSVLISNVCGFVVSGSSAVTVGTPPAIVSQPQPQSVIQGTPATFNVGVIGDGPCNYQWRFNGVDIPGAVSAVLIIPNSQLVNQGNYSVVVTCPFGTVISVQAPLNVNFPPVIVVPPVTQSVLAGNNVTFTVTTTGDPTLTYQWKRNNIDLPGQTGTTLTLFNVTDANEAQYCVRVANPFGTATSPQATLTVNNPPTISGQPAPQTVIEGTFASFTVTVTGDGPCTYQWRYNGVNIPGATATTYVIAAALNSQEGNYSVVVFCPFGTVVSQNALLTVNIPPTIIVQPVTQSVIAGNSVFFSVTAVGDPALVYQWQRNGINLPGQTLASLTIPNVQDANEGAYTVRVSNPFGNVTSNPANLTVNNPPTITGQPASLTVIEGTPAAFAVVVSADGLCNFQWRFNGVNLLGATSETYLIPSALDSQEGDYSVVITCPFGTATSINARLTVNLPPRIIVQPVSQSVLAGTQVTFTVTAVGDPTLQYQWRKNGLNLPGQTFGSLSVPNAQDANEGAYSVVVSNPFGTVTSTLANLTVNNPPTVTGQPGPQDVIQGNPSSFTVAVGGDGPCTFQWRKNGVGIPGAVSATFAIGSSQRADAANYSVVISCPFGTVTSLAAPLIVRIPPTIVTPPASQSVIAGTSATFFSIATGDPTLVYQWRKNSLNIPGANQSTLLINNVSTSDVGLYSVHVTNPYGQATSTQAQLTVNRPPVITGNPQPQSVIVGNTATFNVTVVADGACTFQWRYNGVNIQQTAIPSLTIFNAQLINQGNYSVVVSCPFGTAVSQDAPLTVHVPPTIITHPVSQVVVLGNSVVFTSFATGDPTLVYQWRKNGLNLAGENNTFLLINNVQASQFGAYSVVVTNLYGTATSSNANLSVRQPPAITTQPQPQTVVVGQPASFAVAVGGDGPCSFQWRANGVSIPGANAATFTIASSQTTDRANYSVVVTCPFGTVTSQDASLTVNEPPIIVVHPQTQTVPLGQTVAFSVTATGTPTLVYQWRRNGLNIPGAVQTSLVVPSVTTNDVALYDVVVSNPFGTVTSTNATIILNFPPTIIGQPQPVTQPVGTVATFTVQHGGNGPCTYQWRRNGVNIPGAISQTLTLNSIQLSDQASYSVVVTCPFGTVTSNGAQLTVTEPPRIVFNPIHQIVLAGTNAVISVDAVGTPTLRYQWFYQPTFTGQINGTPLPGATNATLIIPAIQPSQEGVYYAVVQNGFGSVSSVHAFLTVVTRPIIDLQPADASVISGQAATFFTAWRGTAPVTFQWYYNGVVMGGQTSSNLTLVNVSTNVSGTYHLIAKNTIGDATSRSATLTVDGISGGTGTQRRVDAPVVLSGGVVQLNFNTVDGQPATAGSLVGVRVQGSETLLNASWFDIAGGFSLANGKIVFTDTSAAGRQHRFYRIIYP